MSHSAVSAPPVPPSRRSGGALTALRGHLGAAARSARAAALDDWLAGLFPAHLPGVSLIAVGGALMPAMANAPPPPPLPPAGTRSYALSPCAAMSMPPTSASASVRKTLAALRASASSPAIANE